MYIDGHLKGGFQTVEAYAGFCGYFKNWLDTKSIKLSVPRQGEMVAEDYRACLEYVNSEVSERLTKQNIVAPQPILLWELCDVVVASLVENQVSFQDLFF